MTDGNQKDQKGKQRERKIFKIEKEKEVEEGRKKKMMSNLENTIG